MTILRDIGIAVPRRMEVRIETSNSQIFLLEKNVSLSGATFSKEWLESIYNSLMFVSVLLDLPLAGLNLVLKILPYEGKLKKPKRSFELRGKSASFPFAMLLLSIFLNFKLPQRMFFSGCLWDVEGWLARTDFRIVESKARCLSDMEAYLNTDGVAFYVPKWLLKNLEKPLQTRVSTVKIWGVQNILQCLKLLNPKIYKSVHSAYAQKFLNPSSVHLPKKAIREIEVSNKNEAVMLLVDAEQGTSKKTLIPENIKHKYEQGGLRISKVIDLRSKKNTSPVLVYLVVGGQIRWKEMFIGTSDSLPKNRIS